MNTNKKHRSLFQSLGQSSCKFRFAQQGVHWTLGRQRSRAWGGQCSPEAHSTNLPPFRAVCYASAFHPSGGVPPSAPPAGNASRSAVLC
jgi:hypothetical protein